MNAIHAADKGVAYERWATNFNTNAASKSLWDLQIYCGGSYDTLVQKADAAAAHCRELVKAIYIEARTSPAASGIRASAFPMTLWALSPWKNC